MNESKENEKQHWWRNDKNLPPKKKKICEEDVYVKETEEIYPIYITHLVL